ncbi:hypothetical protein R6Q59_021894 [Mikania micrantha]
MSILLQQLHYVGVIVTAHIQVLTGTYQQNQPQHINVKGYKRLTKEITSNSLNIKSKDDTFDKNIQNVQEAIASGTKARVAIHTTSRMRTIQRGTGEAVDLVGRGNFGDEEADLDIEVDLKADLRFEIEALIKNLLHLEAIANIARSEI